MIQVKQSNVKFKYNDSGDIKYSPLLDLLIVDHQSEYIDQAKNRIQGIVNQINNNSSVINNFCNGYVSGQNYDIGNYVFYNGEMYCCTEAIQNSGESFPQNKFKKVTVSDQLLEIKNGQLNRIKKILQCQDSEEVVFEVEDFIDNIYIKYANGQEGTDSDYYATDYIDVKDCLKLKYSRSVSSGSIPTVGMAFYDKDKYFILNSGQSILPQGNSKTLEQIFVPSEACYARFTGRSNSISKESFQLIKINKIADRINNVNDRVNDTNDRIDNLSNNLSDLYLQNKAYQVGDYCIKDDKLYQCLIMVEQAQNENWDNIKNNFRQIKIDKELEKLKNFKTKFSNWQLGNYGSSQTESEGVLQRINKGRSLYDYCLGTSCKQGDIFLIKKAKSHDNVRGYAFAKKDTDNYYWTYLANPNWCAPKDTEFTDLILIAPEGAEYLFVTYQNNTVENWINNDKYATYYINPLTFQIIKILESISVSYNEQSIYNTDDYCIYDGKLYRCTNDEVVNSPQDENSWQETTLISYINSLKNKINNLTANEISYDSTNLDYETGTVGHKLAETTDAINNITENLNNDNNRLSNLQQNKFDNPVNNESGTANQILIKTENGSAWSNNLQLANETINSLESNKINKPSSSVSNGSILMKTQNGLEWEPVPDSLDITATVEDWLEDNISAPQNVVIDNTLTISNAVAEAQATGNLIIAGTQQPTQGSNKIWINQGNTVEEIQISTYEDLTNIVANQYSNKAYKNGEYFINEGILYRVTADIAAVDNTGISAVSKTRVTAGAEIGDLKSSLTAVSGNTVIPMVSNKCVFLSNATVTMENGRPAYYTGSTTFSCGIVECSPGDLFTINGTGGSATRLWGFVDASGNVLSVASASTSAEDLVMAAPTNSVWFITNTNDGKVSFAGVNHNALIPITSANDLNDLKTNGVYRSSGSIPAHWPVSYDRSAALYGLVHVYRLTSTTIYQVVYDYYGNHYVRRYASDTGWIAWVQTTKYSTLTGVKEALEASISGIEGSIDGIEESIANIKTVKPLAAKIFKRVGCIGDSYTEGYINVGGDVQRMNAYAWPHYMEQLTGNIWTNFGLSGSSSKSWVDNTNPRYSNLTAVQAEGNKCQAYIIGLMINDRDSSSPNYVAVGTSADIGTTANSYYAYYYRLIAAVHAVNEDAPIFVLTCPKSSSTYTAYNQAVKDIATYCQTNNLPVFLCDLEGDYFTPQYYAHPVFTSDLINGHYTGIGYEMMAECMLRVISDVVLANVAAFQTVHLIDYDIPSGA